MQIQSLGWRTDLALAAYSGSTVEDRGDHVLVRTPDNPTYWWGNFILLQHPPTPDETATWSALFEQEFPDSEHRAFGVDAARGTTELLAGFRAAGLKIEASAVMTAREVRPPEYPNTDAEVRALVSDEDWEQQVALTLTDDEVDDSLDYAVQRARGERQLVEDGHGQWFGAFVDGHLAASLGAFVASPGLARYQDVHTDPSYRRRGLCGTLVHHAGRYALDERGVETLVMVADTEYSAIRIYRAAGFTETETQLQASLRPTAC